MFNIKLLNNISESGLSHLAPECVINDENPSGIIVRSAKMHDYEFEPDLIGIARAGAGYNNIPVDRCSENGIVVFNTPGGNANAVCELVICALLLASRRVSESIDWCKGLIGDPDALAKAEKAKSQFVGPELAGKTLGVLGLGKVGGMVANIACDMGMTVLGIDPYLSVDNAWGLARRVHRASSYEEVYANADYITIHAPLNEETRNMINADIIAKMKDGVRIVNLARGELVNNDDMKAALASGKVAKYVTDFPMGDIIGTENVVAFPHLGASTPESEENCAVMAAEQLSDLLLNGNIHNSVNFPEAVHERTTDYRITVAHRNIPNMIGMVTAELSKANINIEHMFSRSRGAYAYMMIDTNSRPSSELAAQLESEDGILKVRVLD